MTNDDGFKRPIRTLPGQGGVITRFAWSPDATLLAAPSLDKTVTLWNMTREAALSEHTVLEGHRDWVSSVAWSPDNQWVASASGDSTVRLWEVKTAISSAMLVGHSRTVFDVDWSPQGDVIATASGDRTVGVWDAEQHKQINLLRGHSNAVYSVAWSPQGDYLASCSEDKSLRIWDRKTWKLIQMYEGHAGAVYHVTWSPADQGLLATASADCTIRIWGRQTGVLEGHTEAITAVSFSFDGNFLVSKSLDGSVRLWRTDTWEAVKLLPEISSIYWTAGVAFHPQLPVLATLGDDDRSVRVWRFAPEIYKNAASVLPAVRYTNAKVVVVGDTGVGKTSLVNVLMGKDFEATVSTHGRDVRQFSSTEHFEQAVGNESRETFIWDMAGQPGYRMIHQLHLNEVAVALIVFDSRSELDPFSGVRHWERALRHAQAMRGKEQLPLKIFLVAARIDRGGVGINQQRLRETMKRLKLDGFFETSAKEGWGIPELKQAIENVINWDLLPKVSSTTLFQKIKTFLANVREQEVLREGGGGKVLYNIDDLFDTFLLQNQQLGDAIPDLYAQFRTCVSLIEARGLARRFTFGKLLLLQPEWLDTYASAMIIAAKDDPDGLGFLPEENARNCAFRMPEDERIPNREQERLLLIATIDDLIAHEIALRDEEEDGLTTLVFPSQFTRPHHDIPEPDSRTAIWNFQGPTLSIYTKLVVRMINTGQFGKRELFENAAFYWPKDGGVCRMFMQPIEEGKAELMLFFDDAVPKPTRQYIEDYVQAALIARALPGSVSRRQVFVCGHCRTPVSPTVVRRRREEMHKDWVNCPVCDHRVSLRETAERVTQSLVRQNIITKLDREAETELKRQRAISRLQGKRELGQWDVIFAYNSEDHQAVQPIADSLEQNGQLPWLPSRELKDQKITGKLFQDQIDEVRVIVYFAGTEQEHDTWHQLSLEYALSRSYRVIPVLLSTAPRRPKFPAPLKDANWIDFRKPSIEALREPLRRIRDEKRPRDGKIEEITTS